jgi:hypothetical protein
MGLQNIRNNYLFYFSISKLISGIQLTFSIWVLGWRVLEEVKYSHVDPPVEEPE